MALRDWISHSGQVATATIATPSTLNPKKQQTVANVAIVNVARVEKKKKPAPLPKWCRADCLNLEIIPLPNEGETAGCVNPFTGSWRRLDMMKGCLAQDSSNCNERLFI